ncbi:MAG: type IV pilus secretin PilQ [Thermodesulfobacteriota bacterium]
MDILQKRFAVLLGGLWLFLFAAGAVNPCFGAKAKKTDPRAELIQIEEQVLPDRLRVVLKTTQPVTFRDLTLSNPYRLVFDLSPCRLGKGKIFQVKNPPLEKIRYAMFKPDTVRVVFYTAQAQAFQTSIKKGEPFQINVDLLSNLPPKKVTSREKPVEEGLPKTNLNEFIKEKNLEQTLLKKERVLSQRPKVTFDFYMTNLHNVLRLIGEVGGVNILINDEVKEKKITLSLKEVDWEEAFDSILETYNLKKRIQNDRTFLVIPSELAKKMDADEVKHRQDKAKMRQEELKTEELERKAPDQWESREIQIKNVDAKSVEEIIQTTLEKERKIVGEKGTGTTITETIKPPTGVNVLIISVPQSNTIIARGPIKELDYIEELIKKIDQPISQVMIEARIVEADANFTRDLGIRWGGGVTFADANSPFAGAIRGTESGGTGAGNNYAVNLPLAATSAAFGGLGFAFASTNFNIDVRIQAMEQQGRGKTISSPKVLTMDNQPAYIKQGQSIPVTTRDPNNAYSTVYRDAALVLKVTPHISSSKKIRVKVKIEKNEPDFTKVDSLGNPTIKTKEAETEMLVNDGDTVAIGGILFKKEQTQENKVPGLASIPVLGWLFKTRNRLTEDTELLIFLTPKIMRSNLSERFGSES